MKELNETDKLKGIKKVKAPPFLFSRIEARIQAHEAERVPLRWTIAASIAFVALLTVNAWVIPTRLNSGQVEEYGIETVAESMNLTQSNQLYYE